MTARSSVDRVRTAAGFLVVATVAWSTAAGRISEDTKNDLYVDPWGLMRRALHLWDPQVTWGMVQNQGYGYLFPMGPFYALVGSVLPMWVTQRLWWTLLIGAGYLGMLRLLRALAVGGPVTVLLAALAYAMSPRVISELGGLSAEAAPVLLVPWILAPVVRATNRQTSARRAAALSGLAILCCGGVNATATLLALVPTGLWLVSRRGWWRSPLVRWWVLAVVAATAWWMGPLLLLGRYSPPFLDWIENARVVSAPIGLFDVLRGTTHWLGHVVTAGGPWWPAGYELVARPSVIVATAVVAGLGLAGLVLPGMRHRAFLLTSLLLGVLLMGLPHSGPLDSPFTSMVQAAFDGILVPFRNIHKADPLVRLPIVIGLAGLLGFVERVVTSTSGIWRRHARAGLLVLAAAAVVWSGSPGMSGYLAPRGTFTAMPAYWRQAGQWLSAHAGTDRALVVPASSFGEYTWGRTIDEPLRPLTTAAYGVRDAVPLTPAGTIRFLDAIEARLQSGRSIGGAVDALLATGTRYLVLRNDLDTTQEGSPSVAFARSALVNSPRVRLLESFGRATTDLTGATRAPVEIYELVGTPAAPVETYPMSSVLTVSGASESLLPLADAGMTGPVVFDGDHLAGLGETARVETDGFRARNRYFGATRGQDVTAALTASQARGAGVRDYLPWPDPALRSTVTYTGLAAVSASSSVADDLTFGGLRPAYRPFAALDANPRTAWVSYLDPHPSLTVLFVTPRSVEGLQVTPYADRSVFGDGLAVPVRVRVVTENGAVTSNLAPAGRPQAVAVPAGPTSWLRLEVLAVENGSVGAAPTGLATVSIPGWAPTETIDLAAPRTAGTTRAVVLSRIDGATDGCTYQGSTFACLSDGLRPAEDTGPLDRSLHVTGPGTFTARGTLAADPLEPFLGAPASGPTVSASSVRSAAPEVAPTTVVDGNLATAWSPAFGDVHPALTLAFAAPTRVRSLVVSTRQDWATKHHPVVVVTIDGIAQYASLRPDGTVPITPATGRTVAISFLLDAADREAAGSLEVAEVQVGGVAPPPAATSVPAPCGSGPTLTVDGHEIPTSVSGTSGAAYGMSDLRWTACTGVTLGARPVDRVTVSTWRGTSPARVVLERGGPVAGAPTPTPVPVHRDASSTMTGRVAAGPARVLSLTDNANPGWVATLAGTALAPLVLDGFHQGFLVPAGTSGDLVIRFAPDGTYRWSLAIGGLLGLLCLLVAGGGWWASIRRRGRRPPEPPADRAATERAAGGHGEPTIPWTARPVLRAAATVLTGFLLAGLWGLLAAGVVLLLSGVVARRALGPIPALPAVVAGVVVFVGVIQALLHPGSLGPAPFEALTRMGSLVAILSVVASPTSNRSLSSGGD